MSRLIDLTGHRFGELTVTALAPKTNRHLRWLVTCSCGARKSVRGDHLRAGLIRSCGCGLSEAAKARVEAHGMPDNLRHGHGSVSQ